MPGRKMRGRVKRLERMRPRMMAQRTYSICGK
jgi:hypothetical protein